MAPADTLMRLNERRTQSAPPRASPRTARPTADFAREVAAARGTPSFCRNQVTGERPAPLRPGAPAHAGLPRR